MKEVVSVERKVIDAKNVDTDDEGEEKLEEGGLHDLSNEFAVELSVELKVLWFDFAEFGRLAPDLGGFEKIGD